MQHPMTLKAKGEHHIVRMQMHTGKKRRARKVQGLTSKPHIFALTLASKKSEVKENVDTELLWILSLERWNIQTLSQFEYCPRSLSYAFAYFMSGRRKSRKRNIPPTKKITQTLIEYINPLSSLDTLCWLILCSTLVTGGPNYSHSQMVNKTKWGVP